jgi:hypothetical protein
MMDGTADPSQSNRTPHGRQAACLNCRRSKIRCKRSREDICCDRCKQANLECIVPSHHLGRQKGVKKSESPDPIPTSITIINAYICL